MIFTAVALVNMYNNGSYVISQSITREVDPHQLWILPDWAKLTKYLYIGALSSGWGSCLFHTGARKVQIKVTILDTDFQTRQPSPVGRLVQHNLSLLQFPSFNFEPD